MHRIFVLAFENCSTGTMNRTWTLGWNPNGIALRLVRAPLDAPLDAPPIGSMQETPVPKSEWVVHRFEVPS